MLWAALWRNMHGKELEVTPAQQPYEDQILPIALWMSLGAEPSQVNLLMTAALADTLTVALRETLSRWNWDPIYVLNC